MTVTTCNRYRQPWSSGEVNRLWNEYEIKQLPILEIARLHKRGEYAILHRLAYEGAILDSWADVRGWNVNGKTFSKEIIKPVKTAVAAAPSPVNNVFFNTNLVEDDASSLEDNDDPNDSDYVYESDVDDEDYSVVDSDADEFSEDDDSDSDYVDEVESVDSDSDYEDETNSADEEFDPYSIKQKSKFLHNIISALKIFVAAAP